MNHHIPVQNQRYFRPGKLYSQVQWNNFREVVDEFKGRIDAWYFQPAQAMSRVPDAAFAEMALACLLIDTLSQYRYGAQQSPGEAASNCTNKTLESSHFKFEDFIQERMPTISNQLPTAIRTGKIKNGNPVELTTYPEVLYTAFRCGILHEAHIALYGGISGQTTTIAWQPTGITKYADNSDCPTVVVFPKQLLELLLAAFLTYVDELLDSNQKYDVLRARFKEKFEQSFGVTISTIL